MATRNGASGLTKQFLASTMRHHRYIHSKSNKLFDKILIANRGEIACRVISSAKRLGIKTVAVHSEADYAAKHVKLADEAVCVGPAPSTQSYLQIPAILSAIKQTGAQAVHPGYGFLSENAHFCKALEDAKVTFIGPPSSAIAAMGDKIESKKLAKKAGVNTIPGFLGEVENEADVLRISNEIGYPVMLKASAGGGGKGMRIAWNDKEAIDGYHRAKDEAKNSFNDDRILIEKYITQPRHIEIQLIADSHGNVLYLPERECSIQRRNQKVIEEAPSPFIDAPTRAAMGKQAAALAKAVGYTSAGTVEFLADSQKNFYFLEMNTRLQVEHPITEYITGLDLVEQMIRVAAGEKLSFTQDQVKLNGWAMESRVYAEDPLRNFLPSIGRLDKYKEPGAGDPNVRVDSGVLEGSEISVFYDPLISKLVTYGKTRTEAIDKMGSALDSYVIRGLNHNVNFLRTVMENERFRRGDIDTNFIKEEFSEGYTGHPLNGNQVNELLGAASVIHLSRAARAASVSGRFNSFSTPEKLDLVLTFNGNDYKVNVEKNNEGHKVKVNDTELNVGMDWKIDASDLVNAKVNGKDLILQVYEKKGLTYRLQFYGTVFNVEIKTPRQHELSVHMPVPKVIDTANFLLSPMPGKIITVAVKAGDKVVVGQELAVVEAMKMQNVLRAVQDGVVKGVSVTAGENVAVDQILLEFEKTGTAK